MNKKSYRFHVQKQKMAKGCEEIECPEYDTNKGFKRDPTGYYSLIRPNFENLRIEVAICNKNNEIIKIFRGRRVQDLYHAIFRYEREHHVEWFREKDHIAYFVKELKKAEIALALGMNSYYQE